MLFQNKSVLPFFTSIFLFTISYFPMAWAGSGEAVQATIIRKEAFVYRDPDASSEKLGILPKGKVLEVNSDNNKGFYSINLKEPLKGAQIIWISRKSISIPTRHLASAELSATISKDGVNIHRGPDVASEVLGQLPKGQSIRVSPEPQNGFYEVALTQPWKGTEMIWVPQDAVSVHSGFFGKVKSFFGNFKPDLKRAQLTFVYLSNSTGTNLTLLPAWTPGFRSGKFEILANLGVMPLRSSTGAYYLNIEYGLMPGFIISDKFEIHALAGMQYWSNQRLKYGTLVKSSNNPKGLKLVVCNLFRD